MPEVSTAHYSFSVGLRVCFLMPKETHGLSLSNASASATTSTSFAFITFIYTYSSVVSTVTVIDNTSTFLASDAAKFFVNGTP